MKGIKAQDLMDSNIHFIGIWGRMILWNFLRSSTRRQFCLKLYQPMLIPKIDHPQGLKDYRPIFLICCIYKILTKVLANRLKKVLQGFISSCQSAFLLGRQILDGVLADNELVNLAKR